MVDKIWYNMEELIGGSEERVLIETYWNVKHQPPDMSTTESSVLIETYWNVKFFKRCDRFSCFLVLLFKFIQFIDRCFN